MAALLCSRGTFQIGLICKTNRVFEGQQLRFYVKPLKRQAIRVLSIKEADDLAKRPRNSTTRIEKPKLDRSIPLSTLHEEHRPPAARVSVQNGQRTDKIIRDSLPDNAPKKLTQTENNDGGNFHRQDKMDKNRRGKAKSKGKSDEWITLPDDVKYEKLDAGDKRFGPAVMEAKLSKERDRKSTILLEGTRLVAEGVAASLEMKSIFFTNIEVLAGLELNSLVARGTKLYKVSPKHMKVWSDTVAPSGLMAICSLPKVKFSADDVSCRLPVTIICDRITDAGCLGTLIRSAAAAGCTKVLVTRGSIDPWEPKVIRAGMGAHFHIPIIMTGWELIANYLPSNSDLYLVSNKAPPSSDINERPSKVPRTILQQVLAESNEESCSGEHSVDKSYLKGRRDMKVFDRLRLPVTSYESVDYARSGAETGIGLVVGSEAFSPEAKKFAFCVGGQVVFVGGGGGGASEEDLSQAITSSVVLFEIRRQLKRQHGNNSGDDGGNI